MKKKNFLYMAAAATALTFAACSSEDVVEAPGPNVITPEMATSYANVKIALSSNLGTRAFGSDDTNFDLGTEAEAAVKSLTLVFIDESGEIVGTGTADEFTSSTDRTTTSTDQSISDIYQQAIIKVSLNPGSAVPTKMYAYVNAGENVNGNTTATTESLGDLTNGLVMTNAGYFSGSNYKIAVDINAEDQLYSTAAEAAAEGVNVVEIFVERLAAKVALSLKDEISEAEKTAEIVLYDVNDNPYKIVYDPWSWATTGLADKTYLLKQPWTESLTWANATNRSYWATGVYYGTPYAKYTTESPLTYRSANQIISINSDLAHKFNATAANDYVMEHTFGDAAKNGDSFDPVMTSTSAIVVGQYKVVALDENGDASNFEGDGDGEYDFYVALRGAEDGKPSYTIYSKEDLVKYLYKRNGIKMAVTSGASAEETWETTNILDYLDAVKNEGTGKYELKKVSGKTLYSGENFDTPVADESITATSNAKHYRNGWAYFFVPIKHNYTDEATVGSYGVVRNHSYKLTVNKIVGLGAPLDEGKIGEDPKNTDPDDPDPNDPGENPVDPDPDDLKDAYINATLKVLSWHVIGQNVDL